MEITIYETVEIAKEVSIGLEHIVDALAEAAERAGRPEADSRTLLDVINSAYSCFKAIPSEQIMRELRPKHRALVASGLREQAQRFADPGDPVVPSNSSPGNVSWGS